MKILFVCTGNAGRSPMAAEIAKREVARHGYAFEINSAGIDQQLGEAEDNAIAVARENGCDLSGHEPKQLTRELLEVNDYVFVMTDSMIRSVRHFGAHGCVETLGENVDDPYWEDPPFYRGIWRQLERLIPPKLDELSKMST